MGLIVLTLSVYIPSKKICIVFIIPPKLEQKWRDFTKNL